ncbi:MAG: DUF4288 domain-containing protein [Gammaproteobacteria bacterium]|nr:DUF4288 domain-containing protein [Gammaproteobacteria bacterium]
MWYCAHAIFYFELKVGNSDSILVHENVYLIQADDEKYAMEKALNIAKSNEDLNEGGHLELNEKPVRYLFSGIRKLIEVGNHDKSDSNVVESGVEITYSEFEVDDMAEVENLGKGCFSNVLYRE